MERAVPSRATRRAVIGAIGAGLPAARAAAQPAADPLRIVVNFTPGGLLDNTSRLIAERAQRQGVGTVVLEHRPGAAGNIGAAAAARARPDGRTVLASIDTVFTVNPHLYREMGFDPVRDFVPVAIVGTFPLTLLVHPGTGIVDLAGFAAAAQARPMFYSSAGVGSPGHLAMEHLRQRLGLPAGALEHAPVRGNAEALVALIAGTVPTGFLSIGAAPDSVRSGQLRAIATSGPGRDPALPAVPTVGEQGLDGFDVRIAALLMAPRGTPPAMLATWAGLVQEVLADPATEARFTGWGIQPGGGDGAEAEAWIAAARDRWGEVVRVAGMRLE
jgi:tripartite-type tricarboxylate transporter receptor subunit TctC